MGISVVNNNGSGSFATTTPISYAYSEDVTSLQPAELSGGAGQVSVSAPANSLDKDGTTHPNSALLINNDMTLTDDQYGSVKFQVRQVTVGEHVASVTGNTIMWRLNVEKTAQPMGGSGMTLLTALNYYCGLVEITPTYEAGLEALLDAIPVNFIGWKGNVWEHLKMLCAGVSLDDTENIGLEVFIDVDTLVFRKALQTPAVFSVSPSVSSVEINSFEAAKSVNVINYNTYYGLNKVVKEQEGTTVLFQTNENVSITDSLQVEAGQTLIKRFAINASLENVKNPIPVSAITSLPYTGTQGEYVVVGSDDLPIDPDQWTAQGGSLKVALTENPNEIEITITAPPATFLTHASDTDAGYAPYKVGVEEADGTQYPALYIVGTGVFFKKTEHTFLTGSSDALTSKDAAPAIDNPFITNLKDMSIRGVAAAQALCGPTITLSEERPIGAQFGATLGNVLTKDSNRYRLTSISYTPESISFTGKPYASVSDFNAKWAGLDFSDFTNTALDPATYPTEALKFNEFSVIPLMESA
jgi:hypothetical protein